MLNKNLAIEGAEIRFRNFAGKEGKYNKEGDRNFCLVLDPDNAMALKEEGWNVKFLEPRDDENERVPYLPVSVSFKYYPPKVILITSKGKTQLDENTVGSLDWAELENIDLIIRPYNWEFNGNSGVKAYLKAGYFTIVEDEFESKYYEVPNNPGMPDVGDGN